MNNKLYKSRSLLKLLEVRHKLTLEHKQKILKILKESSGNPGGETDITYADNLNVCENGVTIGLCVCVDPETVGQYTGLKDKNGKEIYEGDIVRDGSGQINHIEFVNGTFWFNWLHLVDVVEPWEVIGNIHDNPHLLEDAT